MICFMGSSHAAIHLRNAARKKGLPLTSDYLEADLIFISEDTPTDTEGNRNLEPIRDLIVQARTTTAALVLTSQVPPGFTRSLDIPRIHHQPETLRIKDAEHRASYPDYIIVGGEEEISVDYSDYLRAFKCPLFFMTWEEAEFSKIAVNMFLASQVDTANILSKIAHKSGANWDKIVKAIKLDKRLGSYMTPGHWQDSKHLVRDSVTLNEICMR
jgi:UDP-glucose 6-dehydrogenase